MFMVSYDVTDSLFTNVPLSETIDLAVNDTGLDLKLNKIQLHPLTPKTAIWHIKS